MTESAMLKYPVINPVTASPLPFTPAFFWRDNAICPQMIAGIPVKQMNPRSDRMPRIRLAIDSPDPGAGTPVTDPAGPDIGGSALLNPGTCETGTQAGDPSHHARSCWEICPAARAARSSSSENGPSCCPPRLTRMRILRGDVSKWTDPDVQLAWSGGSAEQGCLRDCLTLNPTHTLALRRSEQSKRLSRIKSKGKKNSRRASPPIAFRGTSGQELAQFPLPAALSCALIIAPCPATLLRLRRRPRRSHPDGFANAQRL